MRKVYYLIAIVSFFALAFFIFAQEQDPFSDITYPVKELGNCQSREACEDFCDKPENMPVCLDFAEANDLMPKEDITLARKMLELGETEGPGGCQGQAECEAYCDDISNIKECVAFAEKNNLIPPDELAEAKKVISAIERGITPPPCNSKSECDQVCKKPENMKTCIAFAKEAGLMPPEELEEAEKVLAAIEKGVTPPPCGGKDECDEYCSAPENLEQCLAFAEAAGFISPEEAAMARRTGGKGPGNCRGKEACEAFCDDPANGEECINFAVENGFMPAEEAENALKMFKAGFTSGPGGCKGKEECESYCDDISHMEECVDFAEKAGFMSAEDAARARKMAEMGISGGPGGCKGEEECQAFCQDQANMETCINFAVQIGDMTLEEAEQMRQGKQRMTQTKECLAMPCSEVFACLESLSQGAPMEQGEPTEGNGPSPEIQAKVESCIKETEQAQQECLAMPCPEALACLQGLSQYSPMEQGEPTEGGGQNTEIQDKIQSCTQKLMPEGMSSEGFEGETPEEFQEQFEQQREQMTPQEGMMSPEDMEEQIQQQIQQQMEQQIQEQIQEMMVPPAETQPTSRGPSLLGAVLAPFIQLFLR